MKTAFVDEKQQMMAEKNLSALADIKRAKRFALGALGLWLLMGVPITIALVLKIKTLLMIAVLFMHWGLPFIAAFVIEKRSFVSLGLSFKWKDTGTYALFVVAGFILATSIHWGEWFLRIKWVGEPTEALTAPNDYLRAIVVQLVSVGLPEELFFRGFLMTRLCDWLGKIQGLLWSGLAFGSVHLFSRLLWLGGEYTASATIIGCATFLTGLVLGFQYLKTRSIIPSAITHVLLNVAVPPIISLLV